MDKIRKLLEKFPQIGDMMYGKDFLLTWSKQLKEIKAVSDTARILKEFHANNISARIFETGLAISVFRDKSTRTRYSFASACDLLGLQVNDLEESKSQIAHGETVRETANMLSYLTEVIGIRDDLYPGLGDQYQREVIKALDYGYDNGILPQRPCVINLQSDLDHPTQILADLSMLTDHFGGLDKLKGKRMAVTWAYSPSYGKPMSVPQGLIALLTRLGMKINLAYPPGYELADEIEETAKRNAEDSGGEFNIYGSMKKAFEQADIVYPKSWAPMSILQERKELFSSGDEKGLLKLEKTCLEQNAQYKNWECNQKMMKLTRNGNALYQHCLPADITGVNCRAGEVSKEMFDRYMKETYLQAGYKPFVIAAMILLAKVKNPQKALGKLVNLSAKRDYFRII